MISDFGFRIQSAIRNRQFEIKTGYLFVFLAGCLWGSIGLFFRALHDQFGLSASAISFLRPTAALAFLIPALLVTQPRLLKLPRASLPFFLFFGINTAAYSIFYTQAVLFTSVTTAAILLYTAPAFVSVIAWRVWGEPLNARKLIAIAIAFIGCALVARGYDIAQLQLSALGIAVGIGAGLTYGLYSVLSKAALQKHSQWTTLVYALLFGAIYLAFLQTPADFAPLFNQTGAWIPLLGLTFGPTIGALTLYNAGLKIVPASNASLVATVEPVAAGALSFLFLGERLEMWQLIGGALVIGGAIWLSLGDRRLRGV
ncbi:MAG: EamA family transporter [Chloroflexi bacterium]|nr:EamA family transporter [Chloroflexota bacterium]